MAKVVRDKEMRVSLQALYQTIIDFESYPQFLPEVVSAQTVKSDSRDTIRVNFELEVIKRFDYSLEFHVKKESEVKWNLVKSNFFKDNSGVWMLAPIKNGVSVHYELDVSFGFLVPGWVTKKLTEVSLPAMFDRFEARALENQKDGR